MTAAPLSCIRPDVLALKAYTVADATGLVKLDAMENPYPLPAHLQAALGERLGRLALNRYPGAQLTALKAALRQHAQVPEGYDLMLGNGSDELIGLLTMAVDQPGACIVAPEPGFVMYAMSAQLLGVPYHGVPLTPDFELDAEALCAAIARHRPALVYLAYPNNPTANLWRTDAMERVIEAQGQQEGLVVIDEAYQPFASHSYHGHMHKHPHLLLMRTLSKFGLAGVRVGYLIARSELIEHIEKLRPPYNVSVLNAECALFALEHEAVFKAQAERICAERTRLVQALQALPGVQCFPSQANMVLIRVADATRTHARMKALGVLVKNVSTMHPLLSQCLRLTVGTPEENDRQLAALAQAL